MPAQEVKTHAPNAFGSSLGAIHERLKLVDGGQTPIVSGLVQVAHGRKRLLPVNGGRSEVADAPPVKLSQSVDYLVAQGFKARIRLGKPCLVIAVLAAAKAFHLSTRFIETTSLACDWKYWALATYRPSHIRWVLAAVKKTGTLPVRTPRVGEAWRGTR